MGVVTKPLPTWNVERWFAAFSIRASDWWRAWGGRGSRYLINATLSIAIGSIAWSLVGLWRHPPTLASDTVPEPIIVQPVAPPFDRVADAHIFGVAAVAASPSEAPVASNISVDGIIYDSDGTNSLALLSLNGNTQYYGPGQTLADGEVLKTIEATAVVMSVGGELRRLELDIKQADPNARFATLTNGDGGTTAWADAYANGDPAPKSPEIKAPTQNTLGIAIVPAAVVSPTEPALSLNAIHALRAGHFAKFTDAPLRPQMPAPHAP